MNMFFALYKLLWLLFYCSKNMFALLCFLRYLIFLNVSSHALHVFTGVSLITILCPSFIVLPNIHLSYFTFLSATLHFFHIRYFCLFISVQFTFSNSCFCQGHNTCIACDPSWLYWPWMQVFCMCFSNFTLLKDCWLYL